MAKKPMTCAAVSTGPCWIKKAEKNFKKSLPIVLPRNAEYARGECQQMVPHRGRLRNARGVVFRTPYYAEGVRVPEYDKTITLLP